MQLADQDVVYAIDRPLKPTGGILVIKGNLAPDGAVLKSSGSPSASIAARPGCSRRRRPAVQAILERRDDRLIADKAVEEPIRCSAPSFRLPQGRERAATAPA